MDITLSFDINVAVGVYQLPNFILMLIVYGYYLIRFYHLIKARSQTTASAKLSFWHVLWCVSFLHVKNNWTTCVDNTPAV